MWVPIKSCIPGTPTAYQEETHFEMKTSIVKSALNSIGLVPFLKKVRKSFNWEYTYTLNGTKVKGLKIYSAKTENSEIWMGQLLRILLKHKEGGFIDVGVNIGQTLMQVRSLDSHRPYIGFEPNPSCNSFVEELIRINKFANVKLVPVGVFTEDTLLELDLYYDDITNSGGSIIKDYWAYNEIKPHRTLMVPLMSISTISKVVPLTNIGIVKIDVEGAELEVLQSMMQLLSVEQPLVVIEILSAYSSDNKLRVDRQNEILKLTERLSYSIYRIIEDENANLQGLQEVRLFDPLFDRNLCNYLLIHTSEKDRILRNFKLLEL